MFAASLLFGGFDLLAGVLMLTAETALPGFMETFVGGFLVFKGITTMIKFPIWIGPISAFAGLVDLTAGLTLYFLTADLGGFLNNMATVLGVMQTMKGAMTEGFAIVAG